MEKATEPQEIRWIPWDWHRMMYRGNTSSFHYCFTTQRALPVFFSFQLRSNFWWYFLWLRLVVDAQTQPYPLSFTQIQMLKHFVIVWVAPRESVRYLFRIRMCNVRCVCACMWFHVTFLSKYIPRCVRKKLETRRGDGNEEKWNARQSERRRPTYYLMRSVFLVLLLFLLQMMHAHSMNSEHVCMLSSV